MYCPHLALNTGTLVTTIRTLAGLTLAAAPRVTPFVTPFVTWFVTPRVTGVISVLVRLRLRAREAAVLITVLCAVYAVDPSCVACCLDYL